MKRVCILTVIVTMLGLGLGACTAFSRQLKLESDVDSLSYFYGMARTDGVMNYLVFQAGIDTNHMDAFYAGFRDGIKNYSPKDIAYMEGKRIAQMINNQWIPNLNQDIFLGDSGLSLNRKAMLAGFYHGVRKNDDIQIMHVQSLSNMKMEAVKETYAKTKYAELITAGEKLLADNRKNPNIKTTESGLQYKIITAGTGAIPDEKARVKVHYRGRLVDGTEFDSSYKNDAPMSFYVTAVIRGWTEALQLMPVGSKWELYVPQDLAYGAAGQIPTIPPYSTLIFEIELIAIETN